MSETTRTPTRTTTTTTGIVIACLLWSAAPLVAQDRNARMSDRFDVFPDPPSVIEPPRTAIDPPPPPARSTLERVESELDRTTGRVEGDVTYELRQRQLARDIEAGRLQEVSPFERFEEQRDRDERMARARARLARSRERQVVERESQALAAERERFRRAIAGPGAGQAAVDRQALARVRGRYERDLRAAERSRADALGALRDRQLTPEQRAAEEATIGQQFEAQRQQIEQRYRTDRATILGVPADQVRP